jgi:hypothetical protein
LDDTQQRLPVYYPPNYRQTWHQFIKFKNQFIKFKNQFYYPLNNIYQYLSHKFYLLKTFDCVYCN